MINSVFMGMNNTNSDMSDILKQMFGENNKNNYSESSTEEKKQRALELVKENIGLIEFEGTTDSYWKDLETEDTKVMILSIPNNTFIRSSNDLKQELSSKETNGSFLILDGLAYKSNNNYESIVYIKV